MDPTELGAAQGALGVASLIPGVGPFAAIAGVGLSLFGAADKYSGAQQANQAQQQITALQQKQDAVRQQALETSARRQQLENLRNQQRMGAMATNNASGQGALFGSGLQGGLGQISGQSNTNAAGIQYGLESGEKMFGLNAQISTQKIAMANAQSTSNTGAGLSTLGSTLTGSAGTLRNLSGNLLGTSSSTSNAQGYGQFVSGLGSNGIY